MTGRLVCIIVVAGVLSAAQDGGIRPPVGGFLFDAARGELRSVLGFPGSATQGESVDAGVRLRQALLAAGGEYALAVEDAAAQRLLLVRSLRRSDPSAAVLENSLQPVRTIALNATGTAAAVLSDSRVQFLRGLPDAIEMSEAVPLRLDEDLRIQAVSLSEGGESLLLAASNGEHGGVFLVRRDSSEGARLLASTPCPAALLHLPGGSEAVYADSVRGEVVLISDYQGSPTLRVLAEEKDGVAGPVGLTVSQNLLYVVNTGADPAPGNILTYDLVEKRVMAERPLPFRPAQLVNFGAEGVFVLRESGTAYLLSLPAGTVHFVPPLIGE